MLGWLGLAFSEAAPPALDVGTSSVQPALLADRLTSSVWGAGHSLGGALATLAAHNFQTELGPVDIQCYTFGAPRTGNAAFARDVMQLVPECWHVINDRALITSHHVTDVLQCWWKADQLLTHCCCFAEDTVSRMAKFWILYKR